MADEHEVEHAEGYPPGETRTTAPQQEYTGRDVAVGFVVLAVGLAVVAGLPVLL